MSQSSLPLSPIESTQSYTSQYHKLPHIIQQNKYYIFYEALNMQSGTIFDYYEFLQPQLQNQVLQKQELFSLVREQTINGNKIVSGIKEHQITTSLPQVLKLQGKQNIYWSSKEVQNMCLELLDQFEQENIFNPFLENIEVQNHHPYAQFNLISKFENEQGRQVIQYLVSQCLQNITDKEQFFTQINNFLEINTYNYPFQFPDFEFIETKQGNCRLCRNYTKLLKLIASNEVEMQSEQDFLQYISQAGKKYIEIIVRNTQQPHKQCDCFVNQIISAGINILVSQKTSNIITQQSSQQSLTDSQLREQKIITVPNQITNNFIFKLSLFAFINGYSLFNHAMIAVAQALQIKQISIPQIFYKKKSQYPVKCLELVNGNQCPIPKIIIPFDIQYYRSVFISSQTVVIKVGKELYKSCILDENTEIQVKKLYEQYKDINPLITKDIIMYQLQQNPPRWLQ